MCLFNNRMLTRIMDGGNVMISMSVKKHSSKLHTEWKVHHTEHAYTWVLEMLQEDLLKGNALKDHS